eukprot:8630107-Ditylum_brightwellii.AAC.1
MPDSPKPLEALLAKCELIFTTMKETEGTIVLCAYSSENFKNAITHADQIPSTLASLYKYFHQIYPLAKGGYTWPSIWLGYDCETHSLSKDLSIPLSVIDVMAYPKRLQKSDTTKAYWL